MTRPFAAVERLLERLFERPAARLFHTSLQPIQIQRKLERAMDTGRVFSGDHAYVPTRYRVRLNPQDALGFDGYRQTLETEFADALHARARARGYRLLARPTVAIESSGRIQVADIDVIADVVDRRALEDGHGQDDGHVLRGPHGTGMFGVGGLHRAGAVAAGAAPQPAAPQPMAQQPVAPRPMAPAPAASQPVSHLPQSVPTPVPAARLVPPDPLRFSPPAWQPSEGSVGAAYPPPVASVPAPALPVAATETVSAPTSAPGAPLLARIEVRTRGAFVAGCEFRGGTTSVGRSADNAIVLVDDRVSRHHGQLSGRQGNLVYTDLGSTNGSFVNGTRVREIVLGSGDVVRLGNSTLTIQPHA